MTQQTDLQIKDAPSLQEFIASLNTTSYLFEEIVKTSYRPTIIIGLGGSGYDCVRKIEQQVNRRFGEEKAEIFQFLAIDTAAEVVPTGEEPLDSGDFLYLEAFDAAEQIRHLDENEFLCDWWPGGQERPYQTEFSGNGASRVRAVARQVLFNYIDEIEQRIEHKIDRAINVNDQYGIGATSIKFYIIASTAGGTGSGLFLDLCYLTRMYGLRRQPATYVTGVLINDDPFRPKAKSANTAAEFSANTYALLKEINHLNDSRTFQVAYNEMINTFELPEETHRPCNVLYLLGLHNRRGQALDSLDSLTDMIAAEIMVEIASPLDDHVSNVLDNVRANERYVAGQPAAYSAIGMSGLNYPLINLASFASLLTLSPFSLSVLLQPREKAEQVEKDVLAFTQQAAVEQEQGDHLIRRLRQDEKSQDLVAPVLNITMLEHLPEDQILGLLQQEEDNALNVLNHQRSLIKDNVQPLQNEIQAAIQDEIEDIIRNPSRGPRYAQWFAGALAGRLRTQRDNQLTGEQSFQQATADGQQIAWIEAKKELAKALRRPRLYPFRERNIRNQLMVTINAFNAHIVAGLELTLRSQAIICLKDLVAYVEVLKNQTSSLVTSWEQLLKLADEASEGRLNQNRAVSTSYTMLRSIVEPQEVEQILEAHTPVMDTGDRCNHLAASFWTFYDQASAAQRITQIKTAAFEETHPAVQAYIFLIHHFVRALQDKDLLARMRAVYGAGWQRKIAEAYRRAEPFWNFSLGRFGGQINQNLQHEPQLVGFGGADLQVWSKEVGDSLAMEINGVNTKDAHQMLFLKTSHGLPLFALRTINRKMKHSYEHALKLWRLGQGKPIPVHLLDGWEDSLSTIEPEEPEPAQSDNGSGPRMTEQAPDSMRKNQQTTPQDPIPPGEFQRSDGETPA